MVNWTLVNLGHVSSTQTVAKDLASKGASEGTTVVATSQSSGTGRLGRRWASPTGGLYMSFVLRPGGLPKPEQLTLVSAVAVVEGIKQVAGLVAVIRWPNDVMLAGKKLAGIIAEAQSSSGKLDSVVVGVGVNCNAPVSDPTAKAEATSLGEAVGGPVDITKLRQAILDSLSRHYARLKAGADMLELWKKHVATTGKNVSIKLKTDETPFSCLAEGLDAEGGLMVSSEAGAKFIRAEDLEWLRELP